MTALQLSELYELDVRAAPPAAPVASPAPMALVMAIPTATPGTAAATAPATVATTPVPMPVETIAVWMLESLVHALTCEAFDGVTGTMEFKGSGDPVKSAVVIQIKDGKFTYFQTVKP